MKKGCLIIFACFVVFGGYTFYSIFGDTLFSRTYRFRLVIVAETPETKLSGQPIIGSGVWEFFYRGGDKSGILQKPDAQLRGEAVSVDLAERGKLFLLRRSNSGTSNGANLALKLVPSPKFVDQVVRIGQMQRIEIPIQLLLPLVRFQNLQDPRSVELVNPENLAASFGEGTRLVRAYFERTDEPVTTGIEKQLPWLASLTDGPISGKRWGSRPVIFADELYLRSFVGQGY